MRLLVLGHRGMLGNAAVRRFVELGRDVVTIEQRFDPIAPTCFLEAVRSSAPDVVVNAIGLVKQRSSDPVSLMSLNAVLPALLRTALPATTILVQPSTDCVFNGERGWRRKDEQPDAKDAYGYSKAAGEGISLTPNTVVVRTSIVGFESPSAAAHGLLGWFVSRPRGDTVRGFSDHYWNGLTTLEWCAVVDVLLAERARGSILPPLLQPGVERAWTKAEMLGLFRDAFRPDIHVEPVASGNRTDRTLEPDRIRPDFRDQVQALATWVGRQGSAF